MPDRKGVKNDLYLLVRENDRFLARHVEFRHLDVGHGIRFDVLTVSDSPTHGIVKDSENRFHRGTGIAVLFQAVDPVLDFRRRQVFQLVRAEAGPNMPFDDACIGIICIRT